MTDSNEESGQRFDEYLAVAADSEKFQDNKLAIEYGALEDRDAAHDDLETKIHQTMHRGPEDPDDAIPEQRRLAEEAYNEKIRTDAANKWKGVVGSLRESEKGKETLERMSVLPDVRSRVAGSDRGLYDAYRKVREPTEILDRYEKGEGLTDEQRRVALSAGARGFGKADAEKVREADEGNDNVSSKRYYELVAQMGEIAALKDEVPENELEPHIKEGLKKMVKTAEKKYETARGDAGEDKIYEVLDGAVGKWAGESPQGFAESARVARYAANDELHRIYRT